MFSTPVVQRAAAEIHTVFGCANEEEGLMQMNNSRRHRPWAWLATAVSGLVISLALQAQAHAFTLNVEGCTQDVPAVCTPMSGFRFLVEEDNTTLNLPQTEQVVLPNGPSATLSIHKSHAPVVTSGSTAGSSVPVSVPDGRYFVTVLPNAGYALGGAQNFTIEPVADWPAACVNSPVNTPGAPPAQVCYKASVTVQVAESPLPTAQITIFAHTDHNPINNTWDEYDGGLSSEAAIPPNPRSQLNGGLGGAVVTITEAAGQQLTDVFGNPLGTRYGADGTSVIEMGTGVITTMTVNDVNDNLCGPFDVPCKNPYKLKVGEAIIKNLHPGKFGVTVVPPQFDDNGVPLNWVQTSTLEGTKTIDAWVKANEPRQFIEGFGQGFNHVAFGFVKLSPTGASPIAGQVVKALPWSQPASEPDYVDRTAYTGAIEGYLRLNHFSRPPNLQGYYPGPAVKECWVGLNDPVVVPGVEFSGLYAAKCDADGSGHFKINNVPPGTYQLVYWDEPLQFLFGFNTVTVPPAGGVVNMGNVLAFRWFGTLEGSVFFDQQQNGKRDAGEVGLPGQAVNLRFRDATIYQSTGTDFNGNYILDEVFPFFNWLITEVDFARFKATGMTAAVDYGGQITDLNAPVWPSNGNKALQPQDPNDPANPNQTIPYRTETGPALLQAQQLFLGQTNLIDWGKANYAAGENGGITGVAYYSVTRAEDDPRYGAAETWEPGIPRVQLCLYRDVTGDGVIDNVNASPGIQLCDIDNAPFGWADGEAMGPEDVKRDGVGITFSLGDALQFAYTDSWDDNPPSGCIQTPLTLYGELAPTCADAFGTWNQVRPGVFDGGYGFGTAAGAAPGSADYVPTGNYIVESMPPPNYSIVKEEDKNVMFGQEYTPSPLLLPPVCVGTVANGQPPHVVPDSYALFPGVEPIPEPLAGSTTPLCNMKQVTVNPGQNTAADFYMMTEVPKAARVVGFVLNDLTAEFNAGSPVYGEKLRPGGSRSRSGTGPAAKSPASTPTSGAPTTRCCPRRTTSVCRRPRVSGPA